jgi:hypothetical protein
VLAPPLAALSFGDLLVAVAAALAIIGVCAQGIARARNELQRRTLRREVGVLREIDAQLRQTIIAVNGAFLKGTGWGGLASWPESLSGHIEMLVALTGRLEDSIVRSRAVWARGATERARESVESAARGLRAAVELYLTGTTTAYVGSHLREPLGESATGRGYVHPVPLDSADVLKDLRHSAARRPRR